MPKRSRKRPRDPNQLAASIVRAATEGEEPESEDSSEKNPAAVALGRLGGTKGGPARAAKLTADQRKASAKRAADARWQKNRSR